MSTAAPAFPVDRGNRAFWGLVAVVVAFRGLLTSLACCVVCVVAAQVLAGGLAALWLGGGWMAPAALLAVLVVAAAVAGFVRLGRELFGNLALRRDLRSRSVVADAAVRALAEPLGLADRVTVVEATEPFAFTHGLLAPRVVLSDALLDVLERDELAAVLAHEAAHVRSRDPLKVFVARVLVAREFYLPALRHLSRRFVAGRELAADRVAVSRCGTRPVAGALLRTVEPPRWAASPAAAMASVETLHDRITQLETGSEPTPAPTPRWLLASTVAAGLVVLAAGVSAAAVIQQLCMRTM